MGFPAPLPGMVVRYSYLWHSERLRKLEEGAKDRPCLVVVAVRREGAATLVTVAPITRRAPSPSDLAVELNVETKQRLGLDDAEPSWIITNDLNVFAWPGPDLRPVSSGRGRRFVYGFIPRAMFYSVRDAILKHRKAGNLQLRRREE